MKLRALRVAEVGRFSSAVAVEDFSGGLDVLAAPNEAGKSTLFRALETLLNAKHTATGAAVNALTPYCGGRPLVEADFEIGGELWRITKRFGKPARAQLTNLGEARVIARGADADDALVELVGGEQGISAMGLVWVGQKMSLTAPRPDFDVLRNKARERGERLTLMQAIQAEVGALTGATAADAVRRRAEAELGELETSGGKPKKGGRLFVAEQDVQRIGSELDRHRSALAEVQAAQDELVAIKERYAEHGRDDVLAALKVAAAAARRRLAEAQALKAKVQRCRERTAAALKAKEDAAGALQRFRSDCEKLAQLQSRVRQFEEALPEMREAAEAAQCSYDRIVEDGQALRTEERGLQVLKRRAELAQQLERLRKVTSEAERIEADIAMGSERMRVDPVTEAAVRRLQDVENRKSLLEERRAAESPVITIRYEAGRETGIVWKGTDLEDGRAITASEQVVLEIAGVGRIEVMPGGGASRSELSKQIESLEEECAALKSDLGARDFEHARELLDERQRRDRELSSAIAQLRTMAPDGVDSLKADVASAEREIGGLPEDVPVDGDAGQDAAMGLTQIEAELVRLQDAYKKVSAVRSQTSEALTQAETAVAGLGEQCADLMRELGDDAARADLEGSLSEAASRAALDAVEALRERDALADAVPEDAELSRIEGESEDAEKAYESGRLSAGTMKERMAALTERIEVACEAGTERRFAELEGELERASADLASVKHEAGKLKILIEALREARALSRERLLMPVLDRIGPYLAQVFDAGELIFTDEFVPSGLSRTAGVVEALENLSDGTQEQLAVLIRLTYAQLFAENGRGMPLILDDPLVYSDGERLQRMFKVLEQASERHQVVVLTCRQRTFESLRGHAVAMQPWTPPTDL